LENLIMTFRNRFSIALLAIGLAGLGCGIAPAEASTKTKRPRSKTKRSAGPFAKLKVPNIRASLRKRSERIDGARRRQRSADGDLSVIGARMDHLSRRGTIELRAGYRSHLGAEREVALAKRKLAEVEEARAGMGLARLRKGRSSQIKAASARLAVAENNLIKSRAKLEEKFGAGRVARLEHRVERARLRELLKNSNTDLLAAHNFLNSGSTGSLDGARARVKAAETRQKIIKMDIAIADGMAAVGELRRGSGTHQEFTAANWAVSLLTEERANLVADAEFLSATADFYLPRKGESRARHQIRKERSLSSLEKLSDRVEEGPGRLKGLEDQARFQGGRDAMELAAELKAGSDKPL
jgi:hypothetical protein